MNDDIEMVKPYHMEDKDEYVKFRKLARQADRKYELEHNRNMDNGVYKTGKQAELKKLAELTGIRDVEDPVFSDMRAAKVDNLGTVKDLESTLKNQIAN